MVFFRDHQPISMTPPLVEKGNNKGGGVSQYSDLARIRTGGFKEGFMEVDVFLAVTAPKNS